jgi:hypothetical protein
VVREDAEALRRRLYAPGASSDDVDRYRGAGGGRERRSRRAPRPARAPGPPRRRRPVLLAVATVLVLIVGGVVVDRLDAPTGPTTPAPTPLAISGADRGGIEDELAQGNGAGIAAYLVTHPSQPALRSATRFDTVERHGIGDARVTLSPVDAEAVQGRATVLFVLGERGRAGWTSLRREVDSSGEQLLVRQVHRESEQEAGVLTTHTYAYAAGDRPVELRVTAPDGVRWGIAVVYTD